MKVIMDYNETKKIVNDIGWDRFVLMLNEKFDYDFYACSTQWFDDPEYICKLKGAKGDLIILWEG